LADRFVVRTYATMVGQTARLKAGASRCNMKADPFWASLFPGQVIWDAHPFKGYGEIYPDANTWANIPALRHQASNPPPRPAVTPDETELAILKRQYPEADPSAPPWLDIKADLLAAGVPLKTVMEASSRDLVRILDRVRKPAERSKSKARDEKETLAARARQIADRVERLGNDVIAAFGLTDVAERVAHVNRITQAISVDAAPVIMWLERRRHPDVASLEKRRLATMERDAELAASAEAPEYRNGVVNQNDGSTPTSDGVKLTATLSVFCVLFAAQLRGWADDIESEEAAKAAAIQKDRPTIDASAIVKRLDAIPIGAGGWTDYQSFIGEALVAIFSPDLIEPQTEFRTDEGRSRIDFVFRNQAERGFFFDLAFRYRVFCPNVFFECKNEKDDPKNPAFMQIRSRLAPGRGQLGIIVCRSLNDRETVLERCKDVFSTSQNQQVVMVLSDDEIIELAKRREVGDLPGVSAYMTELWRPILFNA